MSEQSARLKLIEEKKRRIEELRARKAARLLAKQNDASTAARDVVESAEKKAEELRRYVDSLVASTTSLTATTPQQQRAKLDDPVDDDEPEEATAVVQSVERREAVEAPKELYEKSTQTLVVVEQEEEEEQQKDPVEEEQEEEKEEELPKGIVVEEGDLSAFVARSARLVERCLGERLVFDALIPDDEEFDDDEAVVVENYVSEVASYCRRQGVGISSCDLSPHKGDLALAAYSGSFSMQRSAFEGQVDLWSLARSVPERTLGCQSAVSACAFSPHDPFLIAAGTVTGQVVCWDTRSPSTLPTHRSPLDGRCPHVGPVFCVEFVDHQIVTASNDGNCAAWTPGQLVETLLFEDSNNPFPLSALDVVDDGDFVGFLAGADDGRVSRAPYFSQQQQQQGRPKDQSNTIDAHFGCVTSIAAHPSASSASRTKQRLHDATGLRRSLFLTTSVDWTVKVWGPNDSQWCSLDHGPHNYVTQAAWSPTNAPVFATAAADGALRVWTLPDVASSSSPSSSSSSSSTAYFKASNYALNQMSFSDDGRRILVADLNGQAKLLKLDDHLARHDPRRDAKLDDALARKK